MRILLIEDDQQVAEMMRRMLADEGYNVDVAPTGERGSSLAKEEPYDAIVLDLELPDRNGMSVLQELRREGSRTPIVVSTARSSPADVVRVLDAGADDYISKPVPNEVLAARIRAAVRRGGTPQMDRINVGDLTISRLTHEVFCQGKQVNLTARQYSLLEYLALRVGEVVRRSELLEHVWKLTFDPGSNVVDVHVAQLRKRLREAGSTVDIRTARGQGYALEA